MLTNKVNCSFKFLFCLSLFGCQLIRAEKLQNIRIHKRNFIFCLQAGIKTGLEKKIKAKVIISDLKRPLTKASCNLFSRIQTGFLKLSAVLTRGKGLQEINSHPREDGKFGKNKKKKRSRDFPAGVEPITSRSTVSSYSI